MGPSLTTPPPITETRGERWANTITHALGALLSAAGLVLMISYAANVRDKMLLATVTIYGCSLLLLYVSSTCLHACSSEWGRHWFRVADHASIYVLIAGTYTPFLLVMMRGTWGWTLFCIVWGLAIVGSLLKIFFVHRFLGLSTAVYLLMGWMVIVAAKPFMAAVPRAALWWVAAGGVAYTVGVVFFVWERLKFNHAIWHLFVMAGSVCHFVAVFWYVIPRSEG